MIFQIIGMLFILCATMLLMSLIVSSGVQIIQKSASWRQKNLHLGLKALSEYSAAQISLVDKGNCINQEIIQADIHSALIDLLQPTIKSSLPMLSFQRSEICFTEIQQVIDGVLIRHIDLSESAKKELFTTLAMYFSRIEVEMRFRFRRLTHLSALVCASLLVLLLQLDMILLIENGTRLDITQHNQLANNVRDTCLVAKTTEQQLGCLSQALVNADVLTLGLWPHGWDYFLPIENQQFAWLTFLNRLLGMICSIVLISLGAPFWFERLKSIFVIKEAIKVKV